MTEHPLFLSTPKFISDLLFVSEVLRGIEKPERNEYLKSVLVEINKNLPSNVYIPIKQDTNNIPEGRTSKTSTGRMSMQRISEGRTHRVLRISTDNAFCLHSKERVPYHIIIEVAYDPEPENPSSEEESNPDALGDNPFLSSRSRKGML